MAKRPSAPRPCTLAPAGRPRALQPIDVFERVLLACAVGRAVVFSVALTVAREHPKRSENSASVRAGAECPLSEVPLYCVSETGGRLLSVLRVREVSVFGGFFVQLLMGIFPDRRKCPSYRKCPSLGGVR